MKNYTQSNFDKEEAYLRAKKKLDKLRGFYMHLLWYLIINSVLLVVNYSHIGWNFGTFSTPFFWGIGLFFHFIGVFGPNLFFGKQWEDKKIQELLDKDKQQWD